MNTLQTFEQVTLAFHMNMGTLRIFTEEIGVFADLRDNTYMSSISKDLADIFSEDAQDVEAEIRSFSNITDLEDIPSDIKKLFEDVQNDESEIQKEIERWKNKEPEKYKKLDNRLQEALGQPPAHGKLVRRGALMMLMSFWEILIPSLVKLYYSSYPSALNSKERVLTLQELHNLGTMENAQNKLISDEADFVVRKSIQEQLKYFSSRLKVNLSPLNLYLNKLVEIAQRRNLLVHNNGVVNEIYLSNIDKSVKELYKPKHGQILDATDKYLSEAIEIVQAAGSVLIQICWRKWKKHSGDTADKYLNFIIVQSLSFERLPLVENMAKFALGLETITNDFRMQSVINLAIAFRESGKFCKMQTLLDKYDWSEYALKYQIAFYTLNDDFDRVYALLPKAVENFEIPRDAKEWPLFKPIRNHEKFVSCFHE